MREQIGDRSSICQRVTAYINQIRDIKTQTGHMFENPDTLSYRQHSKFRQIK